jgi:hypothetical protein
MNRATGLLAAALIAAATAFPARIDEREAFPSGRTALVLIDADALACSPCQASLEALCRAVPPLIQRERMIGVLTYREGRSPDGRRARIIRTKWNGYSRAGGIGFPAVLDEAHVFDTLNQDGTTVIIFDPAGGELKRWGPPFSTGVLSQIVRYLLERRSPIMELKP